MADFTWTLQGTTDTVIIDTDKLFFAGAAIGDKITVDAYNDSTHVKTTADADKSEDNVPNNVKYISGSTADWGDGTEDLDQISEGECTLKINFSESPAVAVTDITYFSYKTGEATTVAPDNVNFYAAELGDTNWTNAEGSGSALSISDSSSATSHDFFVAVSCSPTSVGTKSFKQRIELTYS